MRTPNIRTTADGRTAYKVRFRLAGRQTSETFYDDAPTAEHFCSLLDLIGPTGAVSWLDSQRQANGQHDDMLTLDDWAPRHIAALTGITEGTRGEYRRMYDRRWSPSLGTLPLRSLDRETIAHVLNTEFADSSDKTVRNYHGLLSAICASAIEAGHASVNPCRSMRLPRRTEHTHEDMRLLSQEEFTTLLENVKEPWQPLVLFLAGTGARWGEAAALLVGDLDLAKSTVHIRKGIKWARGGDAGGVGPTKTPRSRRTVTLPAQLVEVLKPLTVGRNKGELLFTSARGGPIHQGNFWTRRWEPAVTAAELDPRPRIHDLRHSHASWLIAAGVPLPVIQRRLGHESITTTVDRYGHLSSDMQFAAAEAANAVFAMPQKKQLAS